MSQEPVIDVRGLTKNFGEKRVVDHFDIKVPRGAKGLLRDNAVVQCTLAQAEVNLRAARGYVLQSMADTWKDLSAGATITVAQRINMRMASTTRKRARRWSSRAAARRTL